MYADVGPQSNNQSLSTGNIVDLDEYRVEYAQLNHKAKAPNGGTIKTNS